MPDYVMSVGAKKAQAAKARMQQGEKFSLRAFHDFVWKNGNVPIALQRWGYLGIDRKISN